MSESLKKKDWHLVTGAFPPGTSGIGAYTYNLAKSLVQAGCNVHVWTGSSSAEQSADFTIAGLHIHRVGGGWQSEDLQALSVMMDQTAKGRRIFFQYSPCHYGRTANRFLGLWLNKRRELGDEVWTLIHRPFEPMMSGWGLKGKIKKFMQKRMLRHCISASDQIFLSTEYWNRLLSSEFAEQRKTPIWLPLPSNISQKPDQQRAANLRKAFAAEADFVIGTFGNFDDPRLAYLLKKIIPAVLRETKRCWLCLGRGSEEFAEALRKACPEIADQLETSGELDLRGLSAHIQSCDLMAQPYDGGIDTSRTSAMVGLCHGKPVVTNLGLKSEAIWQAAKCVYLLEDVRGQDFLNGINRLQEDEEMRGLLKKNAIAAYHDNFSIPRTLQILSEASLSTEN